MLICLPAWPYSSLSGKESGGSSGKAKWFNTTKGYGYIQPDSGAKDDISAVEKAGFSSLVEGTKVTFDIAPNDGRRSARNTCGSRKACHVDDRPDRALRDAAGQRIPR